MAKFQVKRKILLSKSAQHQIHLDGVDSPRVLSQIANAKRSVAKVPLAPAGNTNAIPSRRAAVFRIIATNPAIPVTTPIPLLNIACPRKSRKPKAIAAKPIKTFARK